jgi:plastocyanin
MKERDDHRALRTFLRRPAAVALLITLAAFVLPLGIGTGGLARAAPAGAGEKSSATAAEGVGEADGAPAVEAIIGGEDARRVVVDNSPPVVADLRFPDAMSADETRTFPFPASDPDPFDRLTFTIVSQPESGLVINNGDGTFTFDPQSAFQDLATDNTREVQFTFRASDIAGAARQATITLTVAQGQGGNAAEQAGEAEAKGDQQAEAEAAPEAGKEAAASKATAGAQQEPPSAAQQQEEDTPAATVGMTNSLEFTPPKVTIQVGETVLWKNNSDLVHTVTAMPDKANDNSHVDLPKGGEPFNSGMMQPGDTFRHTFTVPGHYKYFCIPHEAAGMIGEVVVEEKTAAAPDQGQEETRGTEERRDAGGQQGRAQDKPDAAQAGGTGSGGEWEELDVPVTRAPAPADIRGEPDSRGEYLFHASGCAGCHTAPDGPPLAGGRRLETEFGVFHVPNITPDPETGIGRWSEQDFIRAMKQGLSPQGEPYFPAFPYPWYTRIYTFELSDLWAYLQTLGPVRNEVPPHDLSFPFGQRALIHGWRLFDFEPGPAPAHPARSRLWNRGSYLVNAVAHCGACHTTKTGFGTYRDDMFLAGSDRIPVGHVAPNITSDRETGIGEWSKDDIVKLLETGQRPDGSFVAGPMAEVVAQRTTRLTDEDRRAIAEYLISIPPVSHAPGSARQEQEQSSGVGHGHQAN